MALERVPADIRSQGGVARMSDPQMIKEIMDTVTIPVMAKARIGHFVECQVHLYPHPFPAIPSLC
jgi:pyridoxal 5'-phosphate synthase pdxS subunit